MLHLIAILLPPLAILMTGRPLTALINLFWIVSLLTVMLTSGLAGIILIPSGMLPVVHALLVVSRHQSDERQRELIIAITGKVPPVKKSAEWALVNAVLILFALVGGVAVLFFSHPSQRKKAVAQVTAKAPAESPAPVLPPAAPLPTVPAVPAVAWPPELEGLRYAAVVEMLGEPASRDSTTGVAIWKAPQSHLQDVAVTFASGTVIRLEYVK